MMFAMLYTLFIGPIGTTEMIVILVIGLLIFGNRLPEVGRSLGRGLMEFKRGLRNMQDEVGSLDRESDSLIDRELAERKRLAATEPAPPPPSIAAKQDSGESGTAAGDANGSNGPGGDPRPGVDPDPANRP